MQEGQSCGSLLKEARPRLLSVLRPPLARPCQREGWRHCMALAPIKSYQPPNAPRRADSLGDKTQGREAGDTRTMARHLGGQLGQEQCWAKLGERRVVPGRGGCGGLEPSQAAKVGWGHAFLRPILALRTPIALPSPGPLHMLFPLLATLFLPPLLLVSPSSPWFSSKSPPGSLSDPPVSGQDPLIPLSLPRFSFRT